MKNNMSGIKEHKITILSDFIANQIAAGEVVQRPESVIKELVENSVDAGADSVAVVVRGAGKNLIHIIDNGIGMSEENLRLSVKRHATSKIMTTEDLEQIRSFGFRGEALASISSVSNLEIRSKREGDPHGWSLTADPMNEDKIAACNTDKGTQIFVKNLFYNVPARRKFLKSDLTEFRYISQTLIKFALSHPDIRFTFYDNDSLIFDVKPSGMPERIEGVLGRKTAENIMPVDYEFDGMSVKGYVGMPMLAKSSSSGQYLFLNNRSIISKSLNHAVFSAYEHLLERKAHPFYILNLEIDPKVIDINVHPQKHEVKFENERTVYNMVKNAIGYALQDHNLVPELHLHADTANSPLETETVLTREGKDSELLLVNKLTGEIMDNSSHSLSTGNYSRAYDGVSSRTGGLSKGAFSHKADHVNPTKEEISAYDMLFPGKKTLNEYPEIKNPFGTGEFGIERKAERADLTDEKPRAMYWQLHKKFIFTQTEKGVMVIDQHAAHERILYEKALRAMNKQFANSQELLFPVKIILNSSEILLIQEISEDLRRLGFIFNMRDESTMLLNAVPSDIRSGAEETAVREIAEQYEEYQNIRTTDKRDNLAASYSCHAAIKTGHEMNPDEMKRLIDDLFKCQTPYSCPHGRPLVIEYTLKEFDKLFDRT